MNRKLMVAALVVCAAFGASNAVRAQTLPSITVPPLSTNTPYVLDSQRTIVRNSTGECWRTGYWSVALAQSTPVVGSDFPAGCICDKDLMPKPVCEPPPVVVAQPEPAPMAPPPAPVPTSQKVTIPADALFQFDKATLSASGKTTLTEFSDKVKTLNLEAVVAVGHTDRIGSEAYNQKLSERRAQTVKDFLVGQGLPAERVYIEGRGESQPVTTDCTGKDSSKNKKLIECLAPDRRVIIEAVGSPR
jgi:OmpA-OmpF porin, OOP family